MSEDILGGVPELNFEMTSGDTLTLELTAKDRAGAVVSILGNTILWGIFRSKLGDEAALVLKDTAVGPTEIEITDGANGVFQVKIVPADTEDLGEDVYYHEGQMVDSSGNKQTVAAGKAVIRRDRLVA